VAFARKYETKYLRYSIRMNLKGLVQGKGERELEGQFPDDEKQGENSVARVSTVMIASGAVMSRTIEFVKPREIGMLDVICRAAWL
jgi:hypothetical protein